MSETPKPKKKVVRSTSPTKSTATKKKTSDTEITWQASPEAKAKARNLRIIALVAWLVALGLEFYVIYKELQKPVVTTWLVIVLIVVIGALAITGNLLWRKSNKIDPASEKDKVRFFIQNQLGVFIAALAFIPLIIFVFTNKNMDSKQKTIIGAIAILMFGGAAWSGAETNSASQEQYSQDKNLVLTLMGEDKVYWTNSGGVYHLCDAVSDLQRDSKEGTIVEGTIEQAQAEGKHRLTKKVALEAKQCGLDPAVYEQAIAEWESGTLGSTGPSDSDSSSPSEDETLENDSDSSSTESDEEAEQTE